MENKKDQIIITPTEQSYYIFSVVCYIGALAMLFSIQSAYPPLPITFTLLNIIVDIIMICGCIQSSIADGKTIILTPEGCTVKVFFYKKTYAWNQLKTKQWEDYRKFLKSSSGFSGGLFLSPYRVRQKYRIYPDTYTQIFSRHPFSCVYIFFKRDPENVPQMSKTIRIYYEADEWVLRDTLSRWGVEIEEN